MSASADDADEDRGTILLQDIRQIFADAHESFLASKVLVRELRDIEESPWGDDELTASKLAKVLKAFGVTPGFNTAKTVRGYSLEGSVTHSVGTSVQTRPNVRNRAVTSTNNRIVKKRKTSGTRPKASVRTGLDALRTFRTKPQNRLKPQVIAIFRTTGGVRTPPPAVMGHGRTNVRAAGPRRSTPTPVCATGANSLTASKSPTMKGGTA